MAKRPNMIPSWLIMNYPCTLIRRVWRPFVKLKHFLLVLVLMGCAQAPTQRTDKLSIVQGVTSGTEIEFSVVAAKGRSLKFELRSAEGEILQPDETKIVERNFSSYVVHKFIFTRDPGREYN